MRVDRRTALRCGGPFHFVEFHPDEWPIEGLLRRWLSRNGATEMAWVADVVDLANEQIER